MHTPDQPAALAAEARRVSQLSDIDRQTYLRESAKRIRKANRAFCKKHPELCS